MPERRRQRANLQPGHYRGLFENSHTVMLIIDPADGRIVDANPMAERYYGYAREKLLGMRIAEINTLPPEAVKAEMARAQNEQRQQFFFKHRLASGVLRDVEVFSGPIRVGGETLLYSIVHDVTEKNELERNYSFLTQRALLMLALPELADTLNEAEFMQRGLEIAETLTESEISFIHFVNDDEETIELVTWSRRTLDTYCHAAFDRHYPVSQAGIWAEALRQRRTMVFNDYATEPARRGLPEGHAPLQRLISLPVIEQGKVVMLAGVGNKPGDYLARDVETLQLLAYDIWRYVQRGRNQQKLARFSRIVERSQSELYTFDAQTLHFIDVNQGACRNLGFRIEELRQMTPLDIKPEMTAAAFEQTLAPLRSGQVGYVGLNTVHRRKNGSTYPVEILLEISDDANPVFVATARDVTERHRADGALRAALQVVEASPVVAFRWQAAEDWPVAYVSDNIKRWGYAADALLAGQPPFVTLVHPEDLPRLTADVVRFSAHGPDEYVQEYRLRHGEGHYFWVEDHTRIVRDKDGKVLYYDGVITDVDAKKRYEQHLTDMLDAQLTLNRKLEEATHQLLQAEKMASIGQLAAGVAHEINNPIGFVSSNLGTLENYLRDVFAIADACAEAEKSVGANCPQLERVRLLKQDKDYDYLRNDIFQLMAESKDGLQRVARIIRDLRDFSRAGDSQMHWTDLHQGLDSTLNVVWNELKYKCEVSKEYGSLPQVWCDPSQLNQVFMNLLLNAGQAIAERGTITLRTGQQGDEVFVAIADTGSGIAADNLKRIFEPFFTTKPVGTGTGLGLSLSYGIIQKHHGRIEVDSTVGVGTTFTVWLPLEPEPK